MWLLLAVFSILTPLITFCAEACIYHSLSLIISSLCLLSEQLHYLLISILVAGSYTIVVWNIDQSEANTIEI